MPPASLLAYLWKLEPKQRRNNETLPSYSPTMHRTWSSPYLRSGKLADEELQPGRGVYTVAPHFESTQCGNPTTDKHKKAGPGLYDIWSLICVVSFTCCIALFVLDSIFSLYGMGTGVAECIVQSSAMSQTNKEVRKVLRCGIFECLITFPDAILSRFS